MTDAAVDGRVARGDRYPELFTARPITGTGAERTHGIVSHRAELFEAVAVAPLGAGQDAPLT